MKRSSKAAAITYEVRFQISQRIRTLTPSELQHALTLIFDGMDHPPAGAEFTVDFAELSNEVCANLLEFFETLTPSKKARGISPGIKRPLHHAMLTVLKRVAVRDSSGRQFRKASVLRKLPNGCLLFYDHDHSFQFIDLAEEDRETKWIEEPIATDVSHHSLSKGAHVPRHEMEALLQKLRSLEMIDSFDRPVDPFLDSAPDYFDRIQHPMDLGTVEERLKRGEYRSAPELASDIRLTFANALNYNRPRNPIHDAALVVLSIFDGAWDKLCAQYASSDSAESNEQLLEEWQRRTEGGSDSGSTESSQSMRSGKRARDETGSQDLTRRRVKVFWPQEGEWHSGTIVSSHRHRGDRHLVQYDDGMSEWVDVSRQQIQVLESVTPPTPAETSSKRHGSASTEAAAVPAGIAVAQIQKLGKLVWARATGFPWWPAEVCLPTCSEIDTVLMREAQAAKGAKKIMVFYFGEVQYDLLPPDSVMPFDAARPDEHLDRKTIDARLVESIRQALERNAELKQPGVSPQEWQQSKKPAGRGTPSSAKKRRNGSS